MGSTFRSFSSYPSEDGFNFDGIDTPTPINQIKKLEKQNEIAVNIFGYKNKAIIVYQLSEQLASVARIHWFTKNLNRTTFGSRI